MVVDSSALVAILLGEPEADSFAMILGRRGGFMSAANVFETEVTLLRRVGPDHVSDVRALLADARVDIVPFDGEQARLATLAYERFGKGRHPARLNLMDCAAYALAKSRNTPLLFKGDDFSQTDIEAAHHP
ncbi:MAG: type II toxin-antitoxin system VapC family toxin [Brevundimonas sp.]